VKKQGVYLLARNIEHLLKRGNNGSNTKARQDTGDRLPTSSKGTPASRLLLHTQNKGHREGPLRRPGTWLEEGGKKEVARGWGEKKKRRDAVH